VTTLANEISQRLAEEIIAGDLRPGQKLEEVALASRFEVSRTPIREALKELSARGLVDYTPRIGGTVARISLTQLADMLDAECEIEGLCARLASQKMSSLEKQELQALFEQGQRCAAADDFPSFMLVNQALHELVGRGSRNDTLHRMMADLRNRLSPFRRTQVSGYEERLARAQQDHEAVVHAIIAGDAEGAYIAMRDHNARLAAGVLRVMTSHNNRADPSLAPESRVTAIGSRRRRGSGSDRS
jgi:DNA-binding GntR family transcriptional regulator